MYDILVEYLGAPTNVTQENLLYFFSFFLLVFIISCMFDIIVNITNM